ncbi:hypothetical protein IWW50_005927 [Coemansia erecta]|nr:hypothetical protein GGF43_005956 [Coemansia sp. RSA 2618]KAJ2818125.1 hypothetical protein IWW50_005927 [Coemansia erecta]
MGRLGRRGNGRKSKAGRKNTGDGEHYVVEAILSDALVGGLQMYEVKWAGYGSDHDQWINEADLNCPELLGEYRATHAANTADVSGFYELMNGMRDCPPIVVTNTVDTDGGPRDFEFINSSIYTDDVPRPCTPLFACACTDGCEAACACVRGRSYGADGRVLVAPHTPLLECGPQCACDMRCWTRVVQRGTRVKLEIRRFARKGWGVVARGAVARGSFVAEYVGELITFEEAEARGKVDVARGLTYLFDLDMAGSGRDVADFSIDAHRHGNVSHFFNHSCEPNMDVYPVYIEHRDPRLHRLGFFAARDIAAGEELTFDYNPSAEPGAAMFACACGAPTCRGNIL